MFVVYLILLLDCLVGAVLLLGGFYAFVLWFAIWGCVSYERL